MASSQLIQQLKENLFEKLQELAPLKERYLGKHPSSPRPSRAWRPRGPPSTREIDKIVAGIENEYAQLLDSEKATQKLLDEAKAEAFELNKKEIAYNRLDREKKDNERLYDLVLGRMKEANISGQQKTNNVRIVDAALVAPASGEAAAVPEHAPGRGAGPLPRAWASPSAASTWTTR